MPLVGTVATPGTETKWAGGRLPAHSGGGWWGALSPSSFLPLPHVQLSGHGDRVLCPVAGECHLVYLLLPPQPHRSCWQAGIWMGLRVESGRRRSIVRRSSLSCPLDRAAELCSGAVGEEMSTHGESAL